MARSIDLLDVFPRPGRVTWIGLAPARRAPIQVVDSARLVAGQGLVGDHHTGRNRQLTLIMAEHLPVIAALVGLDAVAPEQTRRNIVVEGINLVALKGSPFRVGTALCEHTGPCTPCAFMEQTFGSGALNAMRGHGGICCRVLEDGDVAVGDPVAPIVAREVDRQGRLELD